MARCPTESDEVMPPRLMGSSITIAIASLTGPNHGNSTASYQSEAATEYLQAQSRE
jgi:hypothetical protein